MSLIKANTIKPVTSGADLSLQGDSGGSAVDCLNITSAGDVDFSGNTDAKIKLPSAGGIYESDGSTAILTESGGAVTLDNVALGSGVSLPLKAWVNFDGQTAGNPKTIRHILECYILYSEITTGVYDITMTSALTEESIHLVLASAGSIQTWSGQTPAGIMALHSSSSTGDELVPTTTVFRISAISYLDIGFS